MRLVWTSRLVGPCKSACSRRHDHRVEEPPSVVKSVSESLSVRRLRSRSKRLTDGAVLISVLSAAGRPLFLPPSSVFAL